MSIPVELHEGEAMRTRWVVSNQRFESVDSRPAIAVGGDRVLGLHVDELETPGALSHGSTVAPWNPAVEGSFNACDRNDPNDGAAEVFGLRPDGVVAPRCKCSCDGVTLGAVHVKLRHVCEAFVPGVCVERTGKRDRLTERSRDRNSPMHGGILCASPSRNSPLKRGGERERLGLVGSKQSKERLRMIRDAQHIASSLVVEHASTMHRVVA